MKKKILFIILELESASGICVKNVASYLAENGYEVEILTQGVEETVFKTNLYTIRVIKAKFLYRMSMKINRSSIKSVFDYLYAIQVAMTSLIMWPMNAPIFAKRLSRILTYLHKENDYDIIIPVYTQIEPLVAAKQIKDNNKDIKYMPYFLDSLSGGPTPRLLSKKKKMEKGLRWERKLLKNADGIVMMKSSQNHHKRNSSGEEYYSRIFFLDIPLYSKLQIKEKKVNSNRIVITYVGSLPLRIRNPFWGLKLLQELNDIEIKMIGPVPNSSEYIDFCKTIPHLELIGPVDHDSIGEWIEKSDVLLNIGNNIAEMVPSKIFEYVSYKKPILSFSQSKDDPSNMYLNIYPYSCIVYKDEDKKQAKSRIERFLKKIIEFDSSIDIDELFYLNTPAAFEKCIRKVIMECKND